MTLRGDLFLVIEIILYCATTLVYKTKQTNKKRNHTYRGLNLGKQVLYHWTISPPPHIHPHAPFFFFLVWDRVSTKSLLTWKAQLLPQREKEFTLKLAIGDHDPGTQTWVIWNTKPQQSQFHEVFILAEQSHKSAKFWNTSVETSASSRAECVPRMLSCDALGFEVDGRQESVCIDHNSQLDISRHYI